MEGTIRNSSLEHPLTSRDVHELRSFLRTACSPYLSYMERFYSTVDSYDMKTGAHPLFQEEHPGVMGYYVVGRTGDEWETCHVFPFVRPSKVDIGVQKGQKMEVLKCILQEPLQAGGMYIYLKRNLLACLTKAMHEGEQERVRTLETIVLTRAEAFAILKDEPLERTKNKIRSAFDIRRMA